MQYLLLITGEQSSEPPSQAEMDQIMGEYWAFDKAVADAGVKVGGEALQGLETATTVRVRTASGSSPTGRSPRPAR